MSELTPEDLRHAADVVEAANDEHREYLTPGELRSLADRLEREQAAEAKREKRVGELALEAMAAHYGLTAEVAKSNWTNANQKGWRNVASTLLDRYPALVDGPES